MSLFFSIVIPLYNKESSIKRTLESVLSQNYSCFEVVVVDDGSTDESAAVVRNVSDSRVKLLTKPNGGPSSARNCGINSAKGEWVIFLDADDDMINGALAKFAEQICKNHGYDIYAGNFYLSDGKSRMLYSSNYSAKGLLNPYREWFFGGFMPCAGTCAYRRDILLRDPYDERLRRYEDAEMVLRLLCNSRVYRFPDPVMCYHREESTASYRRKDIREDFLGNLVLPKWSFWHSMVVYEFFVQAKNLYPDESKLLYGKWDHRYDLKVIFRFLAEYRAKKKSL